MTDDEFNNCLERLNNEDLQKIETEAAGLFNGGWFMDKLHGRMSREILDLRMQLAARYCEDVVHLDGINEGFTVACEKINAILDGKDSGSGFCSEPYETLRRRLLALVANAGGKGWE